MSTGAANKQTAGTGTETATDPTANAGETPAGDKGGSTSDSAPASAVSREEFEAFKKQANAEAAKHRNEAKAAKQELDRVRAEREQEKKQLAGVLGLGSSGDGAKPPADPSDVIKASEARIRTHVLKAEFVAVAAKAGVVDPSDAFALAGPLLKGVDVDLSAETVDRAALETAIDELKAKKPYLFAAASQSTSSTSGGDEKKKPATIPDGSGNPGGAGSMYQQWARLNATDKEAAKKFYTQNAPAIKASQPR